MNIDELKTEIKSKMPLAVAKINSFQEQRGGDDYSVLSVILDARELDGPENGLHINIIFNGSEASDRDIIDRKIDHAAGAVRDFMKTYRN